MRITSLFSLLCLVASPLKGTLFYVSQEEPVAPHFAAHEFTKKASTFSFAASKTEGHYSYSSTGSQVPFLAQYGTPQIAQFYNGLPIRTGSLSEHYFSTDYTVTDESLTNSTNAHSAPFTPVNATLRFDDPHNYYLFQSYHMAYTHYLFSGIFFRFNLQFVDQTIAQKPLPDGPDNTNPNVVDFVDHFDQFLGENGHPPISYHNRTFAIERAGYFLGWHGEATLTENLIKEISGTILAGYTFKPTHFDHPLSPAFLPHNQTHGYSAEIDLNIQVADHFGLECCAATTSYGRYTDSLHIVHDDITPASYFSGPPLLGKGIVMKDPGSLWVFELSGSANRFLGFFLTGGYHFSYQELTQLTLEDPTILIGNNANWTSTGLELPLSSLPGQQNTRLNNDPRLTKWKNHTMFVRVGYVPSDQHRFIPQLDFAIHWPVMGQHSSSPTRIYVGSGQLSIRWTF